MSAPAIVQAPAVGPPCPDCEGTGTIARHVCATDEECKRKCLRVEPCMNCLGSGVEKRKG